MKIKNKIFLYYICISLIFFTFLEIIFVNVIKNEYLRNFKAEIQNYVNLCLNSISEKSKLIIDFENPQNFISKIESKIKGNQILKDLKVGGIIIQSNNTYSIIPTIDYEALPENLLTEKDLYYKDNYFYVYPLTKNSSNSTELIFIYNAKELRNKIVTSAISFSLPLLALQVFFTILFYYSMKYTYVKPLEKLAENLTLENVSMNIESHEINRKDEIGTLTRKIIDFEKSMKNIISSYEKILQQKGTNLSILLQCISEFNMAKKPVDVAKVIAKLCNGNFPIKIYDVYIVNPIEKEEFYQNLQIINREEAKEILDMLNFNPNNNFYTSKDIKLFAYNVTEDYILIPLRRNEKLYGFIATSTPTSNDLQDTTLSILYHLTVSLENSFLYEHTEKLSYVDPLTGVYNKRKIDEILENEVSRALRYNRPLSLIFIDIDHFKNINDTYGHIIGDNFLKELALFLLRNTRNIDTIGRFGGEEFVCILPETDLESAYKVGEKLRVRWNIERHIIPIKIDEKIGTLSMGISNLPTHSKNARELLILADNALYKAKKERNKTLIVGNS